MSAYFLRQLPAPGGLRPLRIHSAKSPMASGPVSGTMTPVMSSALKAVLAFLVGRPLVAILLAALVVGVLLLNTHRQKTPVTHRVQHVTLTDAQQMQLGSEEYARTLRANRARIVSSGPQYAEVQRVAKRIDAVASRDKPDFVWRVTLIRKHEANAYCLPGGKIVVFTGTLPLTENDAGLATVLGHEVAHATAEHVAERIERQHLTEVAALIIAGGVAFTPAQFVQVTALLGVGSGLPFSRSQESEADHIGLVYMARAGYDPHQAVAFWKRMLRASKGDEPPEFLSDHPSDAHRVERIEGWLPQAEREYRSHTRATR
jgi:metalloendopeptidase OMA1, mitochondrial